MEYEVIVVGAGHAGSEAALASSRMNHKTLLITSNVNNIADTPCNPSIGGPAKGIVVREIDALGGEMAKNSDKAAIQIKMLNYKKGPAVQALRAQIDKELYSKEMIKVLENTKNLTILEGMVEELIVEDDVIKGIKLEDGTTINSKTVILTTGTYLKANILIGSENTPSGPNGEKESKFLSENLRDLGFSILRLKTGTPPRIEKNSIDYEKSTIENGDDKELSFSFENKYYYDYKNQIPCYLTYTNNKTHEIINQNLEKSSMYGGHVTGVGPRYCPSIEDKVVRFNDKERHQVFLEPEGKNSKEIYIQGFSSSMPRDVQDKIVRTLPGLENAIILKYAYAIEYDAIDSKQLKRSLETKLVENLFTAGQINGTSGYEEAAGQGLIAGINACLKLEEKEPLILKRNEAYLGVLIDDLVTKGVKDPYRLLTSRAEYRLLLRHDNADLRLKEYGNQVGLLSKLNYEKFLNKKEEIEKFKEYLMKTTVTVKDGINEVLKAYNSSEIKDGIKLYDLLKRPEITIEAIEKYIKEEYSNEVIEQVYINIKYEGYIVKSEREAKKMLTLEEKQIPENIDYTEVSNLASEAKQKLIEIKPTTIGQASRISGVNPADIAVIMVYLRKYGKNE